MKNNFKLYRQFMARYRHWRYKNTTLLAISLVTFFAFLDSAWIQNIVIRAGSLGYLGAFFAGIFFVSAFTVAPAIAVIYDIVKATNSSMIVALLAGLGAVAGDLLIFKFLKDKVFEELLPIFRSLGGSLPKKLFYTPYFAWLLPILGLAIIASPLPDEAGIGMLSLSKVKYWQFMLITFLLNTIGIFIIIILAGL